MSNWLGEGFNNNNTNTRRVGPIRFFRNGVSIRFHVSSPNSWGDEKHRGNFVPTQSQISRPITSGHYTFVEHGLPLIFTNEEWIMPSCSTQAVTEQNWGRPVCPNFVPLQLGYNAIVLYPSCNGTKLGHTSLPQFCSVTAWEQSSVTPQSVKPSSVKPTIV